MRFITKETTDGNLIACQEEAMVSLVENVETEDFIWVWKHPKSIYLTSNSLLTYANVEFIKQNNYPIVRSNIFKGNPTSIIITGYDFGVCASIKSSDLIPNLENFIKKIMIDSSVYISKRIGIEVENKNNDIVISGTDRKISGMIWKEKENIFSSNQAFSISLPPEDINSFFKLPEEKFIDKSTKSPSERMTSIKTELANIPKMEIIIALFREYFVSIGLELQTVDDFSQNELSKIEELKIKHLSEEWIERGDILSCEEPMDAFQKYITEKDLSDEEESLLLSVFKNKLPTAEKELETGAIIRKKYGNN